MIDLHAIIREFCFKMANKGNLTQLVQSIRHGILKQDSDRYIRNCLFEKYQTSKATKQFDKWYQDRIANLDLGYGIVFELEMEITERILDWVFQSIENMEDITITISFKDGMIIKSDWVKKFEILDFAYLYPHLIKEDTKTEIKSK